LKFKCKYIKGQSLNKNYKLHTVEIVIIFCHVTLYNSNHIQKFLKG